MAISFSPLRSILIIAFCISSLFVTGQAGVECWYAPSPLYRQSYSDHKMPEAGFRVSFTLKKVESPLRFRAGIGLLGTHVQAVEADRWVNVVSDRYYLTLPVSFTVVPNTKKFYIEPTLYLAPVLALYKYEYGHRSWVETQSGTARMISQQYNGGDWAIPDQARELGIELSCGYLFGWGPGQLQLGSGFLISTLGSFRPMIKIAYHKKSKLKQVVSSS